MKKRLSVVFIMICILSMIGCGKKNVMALFSNQSGIDLTAGTIESEEDTHGGFLGDGCTLIVADYTDSLVPEMKANEHWHSLPLSGNLQTFVNQPFDDTVSIPQIKNGYYYFYDRHDESKDHYDDTDLLNRSSLNFTLAIYDSDTNQMYLLEYDT